MLIEKENVSRTLDTLGRITIPKSLRSRLGYTTDTKYEFLTIELDGRKCIVIAPEGLEDSHGLGESSED
jgi:bifunctional DNA-binding transcriptional regulator/antitoxin component of YhaV-PrlF toxin-antitoxin module